MIVVTLSVSKIRAKYKAYKGKEEKNLLSYLQWLMRVVAWWS